MRVLSSGSFPSGNIGDIPVRGKLWRKKKMKIDKAAIKSEFQRHDRDTGSSEVQIAILTKEIEALTEHLKANKKDHSSRYGLLRKVANRRNLLDYLKRENEAGYKELIKKLGLRR